MDNRVNINAQGDIIVTYLHSNDHDVTLKSKRGGIKVDYLNAGPNNGDVYLYAEDYIILSDKLFNGTTGIIKAGDDSIHAQDVIFIYCRKNKKITASLIAGDKINFYTLKKYFEDWDD